MDYNKTQMFIPKPARPATLFIVDKRKRPLLIPLSGDATIGRDYPGSDRKIRIESSIVGRKHGELVYDNYSDNYYYIDNNSLNGTFINGRKLQPYNSRGSKAYRLSDGDVLRIDRSDLSHPHHEAVLMIFSRSFDPKEHWSTADITTLSRVSIGRAEGNNIRLDDMMASRLHAQICATPNGVVLYDCNSQNGIIVNGKKIYQSTYLNNNDVIRIANTMMIFTGSNIVFNSPGDRSGCLSVDIHDQTFGSHTIIKDIAFEADTKDFILILGGSGAGKTTLINAVLGEVKTERLSLTDRAFTIISRR